MGEKPIGGFQLCGLEFDPLIPGHPEAERACQLAYDRASPTFENFGANLESLRQRQESAVDESFSKFLLFFLFTLFTLVSYNRRGSPREARNLASLPRRFFFFTSVRA
jgi:hypothetical protein